MAGCDACACACSWAKHAPLAEQNLRAPLLSLPASPCAPRSFRVLVCGGDGTVTWVLSSIEELSLPYTPPVAVLPLGTGNDLARVLGWGKGVRFDSIGAAVGRLDAARVAFVDRWVVRGHLPEGRQEVRMANYMSIGCDAKAALLWARMSRAAPLLFRLRLLNKLWYIVCGTPEFFLHTYSNLSDRLRRATASRHRQKRRRQKRPRHGRRPQRARQHAARPLPPPTRALLSRALLRSH